MERITELLKISKDLNKSYEYDCEVKIILYKYHKTFISGDNSIVKQQHLSELLTNRER